MPPNMTSFDNAAANMPNTYDNNVVQQDTGLVSIAYIKSIPGIIKAGQMLTCVCTLICASVWQTSRPLHGGGYVSFVSMVSLIFIILIYVTSIFRIHEKIKNALRLYVTIEFFAYAGLTLCWIIAAIVAAAYGNKHASIGACAFFCFVGTGLFGADTYFGFLAYRNRPTGGGGGGGGSSNAKNNDMSMESGGPGPAY